uniref:DUF1618 domain-containing protein n=1 Tax=Aegilops tauschii TaxID=37682 RepID=M8CEF4_AEGTA
MEMEGSSFPASSFQPPAIARASARYAPWALLDSKAYFAALENDTTGEATTSTGHAVRVTFCLADPPAISHFCVHGPGLDREDFTMEPQVHSSTKGLVLLRFAFTIGPRATHRHSRLAEYYVYKAGRGKPPSLTPIPRTPPGTVNSSYICVLPLDDDDSGEFLLAELGMTRSSSDYELYVFSSKTGEWTIRQLRLQTPPGVRDEDLPGPHMDKVIALGGGAVGWVDLWRGIVTCNVIDENPALTLIPIPAWDGKLRRLARDITCCSNGFIKLVDLDLRFKKTIVDPNHKTRKVTEDLDSVDIIYDSDLLLYDDDACAEHTFVSDGWKIRTCYRHTSWDYWRKGHAVDIDEISVDNPDHFTLLPQLWDAEAGRPTLRNLLSAYGIGIGGDDDVVYLMSKVTYDDKNAWMVGVNLGKKTLDVVVSVSSERVGYYEPDFLACGFSEYLNATPSRCADEVASAPNQAQDYHLSSDNVPLQQNMWNNNGHYYNGCFDGYGAQPSNCYVNYQHPPACSANLPQPLHLNFASYGLGCAYQVNAQSICYPVLYTDAGGRLWWVALPLGSAPPPSISLVQWQFPPNPGQHLARICPSSASNKSSPACTVKGERKIPG